MKGVFRPCTIIPSELYVERFADQKLLEVIKDAGRPGYVLVSRQMGKTNLLLHAKEKLETKEEVYIYIDLSNKFDDERSCFRNIVDTAIETHEEVLGHLFYSLYENRKKTDALPPHKEHERELRTLLKHVKKLVIILDEVDALTNTSYSDRIFAQIRSIYFSRTNFPEYEKLTYVLSGVAEPVDIIKDKDISPFNIGEKIFLDDFTFTEFEKFVGKSTLDIKPEIVHRVFYWTQGNPRMSWEIVSRVESFIIKRTNISKSDVDQIVQDTYLDKNDIPPVDHIKELLINDPKLRNSVIELHYGKGATLSSYEKSRLFLSGIVDSNFSDLKFKNPILSTLLSLDWISSIDANDKELYNEGFASLRMGRYEEAIVYFEKYLDKFDKITVEDKASTYMHLASCYYETKKYEKALYFFKNSSLSKDEYKGIYIDNLYHQGLCEMALGQYDNAVDHFIEVIKEDRVLLRSMRAKLNLAGCYYYTEYSRFKTEIRDINLDLERILKSEQENIPEKEFKEIAVNVFYNLGRLNQLDDNLGQAELYFKKALNFSSKFEKPTILYNLSLLKKGVGKLSILEEVTEFIKINCLKPISHSIDSPLFFDKSVLNGILCELIQVSDDLFSTFLNYVLDEIYFNRIKPKLFLKELANDSEEIDLESSVKILRFNYLHYCDDLDLVEEHHHLKFIALFSSHDDRKEWFSKYYKLLENKFQNLKIDDFDFRLLSDQLTENINLKLYDEAKSMLNFLESIKPYLSDKNLANYILFDFLEISLLNSLNNSSKTLEKAHDTLRRLDNFTIPPSKYLLPENLIRNIRIQVQQVISTHSLKSFENVKIKRNDYVEVFYFKTNQIKILKYKKVLDDISKKLCKVTRLVDK